MFDLKTLALADTTELHLVHPVTGDPLFADGDEQKQPLTVTLYGTASKQYRNHTAGMQNRHLKRQARKENVTADLLRDETIGLAVACTAKVCEYLTLNGEKIETTAQIRSLYSDARFGWLLEQVQEAVGDVENFLGQ